MNKNMVSNDSDAVSYSITLKTSRTTFWGAGPEGVNENLDQTFRHICIFFNDSATEIIKKIES